MNTDAIENMMSKPIAMPKSVSIVEAKSFVLKNARGIEAIITNYGRIIMSLRVPDRLGNFENIVLGFDMIADYQTEDYQKENPYFGAIVGRHAGIIKNGKFFMDGHGYQVTKNFGTHHLHGGESGFDKVIWDAEYFKTKTSSVLKLSHKSPDGEEGFPGNLHSCVTYELNNQNEFHILITAIADKKTPVSLTSHAYFNLKGSGRGDVGDHEMVIHAYSFVEIDESLVPTGRIRSVNNTPMDFRRPKKIGHSIDESYAQLHYGEGYDVTYCIDGFNGRDLLPAAILYHESTGRQLELFTTLPGIHFYSGNSLTEKIKSGFGRRSGLCLETQYYPDSPNHINFPSAILDANTKFEHKTVIRFSVS